MVGRGRGHNAQEKAGLSSNWQQQQSRPSRPSWPSRPSRPSRHPPEFYHPPQFLPMCYSPRSPYQAEMQHQGPFRNPSSWDLHMQQSAPTLQVNPTQPQEWDWRQFLTQEQAYQQIPSLYLPQFTSPQLEPQTSRLQDWNSQQLSTQHQIYQDQYSQQITSDQYSQQVTSSQSQVSEPETQNLSYSEYQQLRRHKWMATSQYLMSQEIASSQQHTQQEYMSQLFMLQQTIPQQTMSPQTISQHLCIKDIDDSLQVQTVQTAQDEDKSFASKSSKNLPQLFLPKTQYNKINKEQQEEYMSQQTIPQQSISQQTISQQSMSQQDILQNISQYTLEPEIPPTEYDEYPLQFTEPVVSQTEYVYLQPSLVPQQVLHQPERASCLSTSAEQGLDADDSLQVQTEQTAQDEDKSFASKSSKHLPQPFLSKTQHNKINKEQQEEYMSQQTISQQTIPQQSMSQQNMLQQNMPQQDILQNISQYTLESAIPPAEYDEYPLQFTEPVISQTEYVYLQPSLAPQQVLHQSERASYLSTSGQQVLDADDPLQVQTVQTAQDEDKSFASKSSKNLPQLFLSKTQHNKINKKQQEEYMSQQTIPQQSMSQPDILQNISQYTLESAIPPAEYDEYPLQFTEPVVSQTQYVYLQPSLVPQQVLQQPEKASYLSTSGQQVLDADDPLQVQTVQTAQNGDKSFAKLSKNLSQLSLPKIPQKKTNKENLNIQTSQYPSKAVTTLPQSIRVLTNMFEIILKENFVTTAVHYDVKIVPTDSVATQRKSSLKGGKPNQPKRELKNKTLFRKIFEKWRQENYPDRHPAYDGMASAFVGRDFPFVDTWFGQVNFLDDSREKERTFDVAIKKAGVVDLSWLKNIESPEENKNQTAIQVLDIILRHAPASRLISVGRSFFTTPDKSQPLPNGLCMNDGGFMSAVIGRKPYLNVDVAHKAFVASGNVIDIMYDIVDRRSLDPRTVQEYEQKISRIFSGIKVNYVLPSQPSTKRTYRINGLGPVAATYQFDAGGKMLSIQQYFKDIKKYKMMYPDLPCLWVGKREGKIYLPAELCTIVPGQAFNKKLNESQTTAMIKYAATNTKIRQTKIKKAFEMINMNEDSVVKKEFNLEVSAKMTEVDAKILSPPELLYDNQLQQVKEGTWQAKRFSIPAQLENNSWVIVNVCSKAIPEITLRNLEVALQKAAPSLGMKIGKAHKYYHTSVGKIECTVENIRNLKLMIIIVPNHTDAIYGKVKKISELRIGILTQCIKIKNVLTITNYPKGSKDMILRNMLLKINAKLNGINHTFNQKPFCLRDKKYMLIGADVSHPSPDAKNIPSIAAIAASHDETAFKYNTTIRLQQPRQEEIADLKEIMLKHIKFYVAQMRAPPEIIIFYRDGVSEGQVGMILDKEIKSIKDACKEYARERLGFNPQLTFVIVQKRHHVRLFPTCPQDSAKNVKVGTIVDTEITHPNHIDFYLLSHTSVKGTSRPTKYRCIYDENNFTQEQLEELTYHLCHIYARCTKSVSYPAPTYYAHLAAYRGRMWIQENKYIESDFLDKQKCKLEPILNMPMMFV